jgi:pimeloyl-ACP methyl ester carboxylesterase
MSFITTRDNIRLWVEEAGSGSPILFIHEFADDHREWTPQFSFFSRRHRCVAYSARGYFPSDVPAVDRYSQSIAVADAIDVLDSLKIEKAHVVGHSMGGFCALHLGLQFPERLLSIVASGTGYGAVKETEDYFKSVSLQVAENFEEQGAASYGKIYSLGASRVQFLNKDPKGWSEFQARLCEHSSEGAGRTMRGVQANRPSLYDLEAEFRNLEIPTLIITGDEDDHCLQPGLFLKRTIPRSGLLVMPKTGHAANLEESELFNRSVWDFISLVECNRWDRRDPRATPLEIMKIS